MGNIERKWDENPPAEYEPPTAEWQEVQRLGKALDERISENESLRQQLEGAVDAIRTLREYIGNIEGEGPIRYTEALELCDSFLSERGGQ